MAPSPAGPTPSPSPSPSPSSATTPTPSPAIPVAGAIGDKWRSLGADKGVLGAPTAKETCTAGKVCSQDFTGGQIFWTASTGAHAVVHATGNTGAEFQRLGGAGVLGYPVTDQLCLSGRRCYQRFSSGADITRVGDGPFVLIRKATGIGARFFGTGAEQGALGFPTSREQCGLVQGGCYQSFEAAVVVWARGLPATITKGAIRARWGAGGHERGSLGYPLTDEVCGGRSGCYQNFQGGAIFWSPATGARATRGGIGALHRSLGAAQGWLGYPQGEETCGQRNNGCFQNFQGGTILWSPATPAVPVRGAIKAAFGRSGWHNGSLGYPLTGEQCAAGQCIQRFQGGFISWSAATGQTRQYANTVCNTLIDGRSKYSGHGANRVTFAVASGYLSAYVTVSNCQRIGSFYVLDWATYGTAGASGFKPPGVASGPTRNLFSPTGSYSITQAFGVGNPGTALPYITLNPRSRWGGNPWTPTYNKYFESSNWVGWDENMWYFATRWQHDYRQGAVINYNRPPDSPIVQDAGFAIFLHGNPVPTAGCIAVDDWHITDWVRKARSGDRIIMGVSRDLFR